MANTLLDQLRSDFNPAAVGDLARALNESTAPAQKAIDGLLPAVTSGVINLVSTSEGAATLYRLLQNTPFDTEPTMTQLVETDSHRQKSAESGNRLLNQLFGDRPQRLAESTASYSGVSTASATTMTGLVMSVLMGYLHKLVTTQGLTPAQLAVLLQGESTTARAAIPAALAGLLGWFIGTGTTRPVTTTTTTIPTSTVVERTEEKAGTPWWYYLLGLLALLLLLFFLLRSCNRDKTVTETTTETTTAAADSSTATDTVGNVGTGANGPEVRVGVDLPGGRKLNVNENSFNYNLAQYLADKSRKPNRVFTFDNLTFDTNSANITTEAKTHVNDLIEIMKAYPDMAIRIEGNTDSTGDDAINDPPVERTGRSREKIAGSRRYRRVARGNQRAEFRQASNDQQDRSRSGEKPADRRDCH